MSKTKTVKLSLSQYQLNTLNEITGLRNKRDSIVEFLKSGETLSKYIDGTPRECYAVRLPIDVVNDLLKYHHHVSKALMMRMNVVVDKSRIKHNNNGYQITLSATRTIHTRLKDLGKGDASEGLRMIVNDRTITLSESQRDALMVLGGGSVEEGLKSLVGY